MIEFIAKYWLEVFFGLICATIAGVAKYLIKSLRKERQDQIDDIKKTMQDGLTAQKEQIERDMNVCSTDLRRIVSEQAKLSQESDEKIHKEIDNLKDGMLSMQGRNFKNDCHRMLLEEHVITLNEFDQLLADHIVYNKLGGNHEGDALFSMVEAKYKNSLGK